MNWNFLNKLWNANNFLITNECDFSKTDKVPKTILNTNAELGLSGTSKKPIKPAAIIRGIILGIKEIIIIFKFLNNNPIIKLIIIKARNMD